jgi:L-2-hydroxyglutarate oxidase LhgO
MECAQGAINIIANDGAHLQATTVVNAAGLAAPALALRTQGWTLCMCRSRATPRATISRWQAVRRSRV